MGFGRKTLVGNGLICLYLSYLSFFSEPALFGQGIQYDFAARMLGSAYLTFALLSLAIAFETAVVRIFGAKAFALMHLIFFLGSLYSFIQATVPLIMVALHLLMCALFAFLTIRGVGHRD